MSGQVTDIDWAAVFDQHGEAMLRAAEAMVKRQTVDGKTAEDFVGSVLTDFITSSKKAATFAAHPNPGGYLVVAVKNKCKDGLKRAKRQEQIDPQADDADEQFNTDPNAQFGDAVGDAVSEAERRADLAAAVVAALDDLDDRQRYVVQQVVMNKRTCVEVGLDLDISAQRVGQLRDKALSQLESHPAFAEYREIVDKVPTTTPEGQP